MNSIPNLIATVLVLLALATLIDFKRNRHPVFLAQSVCFAGCAVLAAMRGCCVPALVAIALYGTLHYVWRASPHFKL